MLILDANWRVDWLCRLRSLVKSAPPVSIQEPVRIDIVYDKRGAVADIGGMIQTFSCASEAEWVVGKCRSNHCWLDIEYLGSQPVRYDLREVLPDGSEVTLLSGGHDRLFTLGQRRYTRRYEVSPGVSEATSSDVVSREASPPVPQNGLSLPYPS